ncbi:MAG TPA: hypothetical protein ENO30_06280 [Thermodesulfobium narugense]|nr:hypothetical protein [Thermodesulfobium narugense]
MRYVELGISYQDIPLQYKKYVLCDLEDRVIIENNFETEELIKDNDEKLVSTIYVPSEEMIELSREELARRIIDGEVNCLRICFMN